MSAIVGTVNAIGGAAVSAANSVGWFIPMLVAAVAYFQYEELMSPESRPIDIPSESLYDKYDFIIVGAGSAGGFYISYKNATFFQHKNKLFILKTGAVLANRLTEVENWNVLLLEAGGDETEISDVPLMAGYLQLSKLDWKYKSEPQGTACLGEYNTLKLEPSNLLILNFHFLIRSNDWWPMQLA